MSMTNTTSAAPAAAVTTWTIDSARSRIGFAVRNMMIETVNGAFQVFDGTLRWDGNDMAQAAVEVRIATQSITTHNQKRDDHLRSNDFFAVEQWPTITFTSTRVEPTGPDRWDLYGELTIRDHTRPIVLAVAYQGQDREDGGQRRAEFTGTTSLRRKDFGITWNERLDGGGVVVGNTVKVALHISAVRQG
jgi:polyisoprenoid-binding protein YceI